MRTFEAMISNKDRIADSLAKSFRNVYGGESADYLEAATKFVKLRRDATERGNGGGDRSEVMKT